MGGEDQGGPGGPGGTWGNLGPLRRPRAGPRSCRPSPATSAPSPPSRDQSHDKLQTYPPKQTSAPPDRPPTPTSPFQQKTSSASPQHPPTKNCRKHPASDCSPPCAPTYSPAPPYSDATHCCRWDYQKQRPCT